MINNERCTLSQLFSNTHNQNKVKNLPSSQIWFTHTKSKICLIEKIWQLLQSDKLYYNALKSDLQCLDMFRRSPCQFLEEFYNHPWIKDLLLHTRNEREIKILVFSWQMCSTVDKISSISFNVITFTYYHHQGLTHYSEYKYGNPKDLAGSTIFFMLDRNFSSFLSHISWSILVLFPHWCYSEYSRARGSLFYVLS